MKRLTYSLLATCALLISLPALAQQDKTNIPNFSAFAESNKLYLTILEDGCNYFDASLVVSDSCKSDRKSRELSPVCNVELQITATRMACPSPVPKPNVFVFDLAELKITPEAQYMHIVKRFGGIEVTVSLARAH